jgi:transglutaminase-like putative cysteine protease
MNKKIIIAFNVLFLILLSLNIFANEFSIMSNKVITDINISGSIEITNFENIEDVDINLKYFPKEFNGQKIILRDIYPEDAIVDITDEQITFRFKDLRKDNINYGINSRVEKTFILKDIPNKIKYPLEKIPEEYNIYLLPSYTIDSDNDDIISLAYQIAGNEDDLFIIVTKVAEWVNQNVEYNLSTLAIKSSLPASWVLENKEGVCDEITNLFMALLRSLGIPVRFISGISYTSSELANNWDSHGWAEVYFPSSGWIPFDVTYNQLGYVDPTHIILSKSLDATQDSTNYRWKGENSNVNITPLNIETTLVTKSGIADENLNLNSYAYSYEVGVGSYNMIFARINNNRNSYAAPVIHLSNIEDIEIHDENTKTIILKPDESKLVNWLVKSGELERGYRYKIPIKISSLLNSKTESSFLIIGTGVLHKKEDFRKHLESKETINKIDNTNNLDYLTMRCKSHSPDEFYIGMSASIICYVENEINKKLDNVKLCIKESCETFSINPFSYFSIEYDYHADKSGANIFIAYLEHNNFKKHQVINVPVKDSPYILIKDFEYPKIVSFEDIFDIKFTLKRTSHTEPLNINVNIAFPLSESNIPLTQLNDEQELSMKMHGYLLNNGENIITINTIFDDTIGRNYSLNEEIIIILDNLSLSQRIRLRIRSILIWVSNLI